MADVVVNGRRYVPESNAAWTPVEDEYGNPNVPDDAREVLCFLNGHVDIGDAKGRNGGGWGVRLGWYDADKCFWRAGGERGANVTHWMDLPSAPVCPGAGEVTDV